MTKTAVTMHECRMQSFGSLVFFHVSLECSANLGIFSVYLWLSKQMNTVLSQTYLTHHSSARFGYDELCRQFSCE